MAILAATMPDALDQVGATITSLRATLVALVIRYGLQVLAALAILVIGFRIARWAGSALEAWLTRQELDISLRDLVVRIFRLLILAGTVLVAAEKAGIPVTSLVAGVGVAGVGAGLALQGVLGNVFAGLTILFTRPFRVGEYIEVLGVRGQVTEITVFTTTLLHADQSKVVVPNRKIGGEILHNYGTKRQMELRIEVSASVDFDKALAIAQATLDADSRILKEPAPLVGMKELSAAGLIITVSPWVGVADYDRARADVYQALIKAFRAGGLPGPSPQYDVRIIGRTDALPS